MSTIDPEGVLKMVQSKITETELGHYLISQKENINQICAGNKNFKKKKARIAAKSYGSFEKAPRIDST